MRYPPSGQNKQSSTSFAPVSANIPHESMQLLTGVLWWLFMMLLASIIWPSDTADGKNLPWNHILLHSFPSSSSSFPSGTSFSLFLSSRGSWTKNWREVRCGYIVHTVIKWTVIVRKCSRSKALIQTTSASTTHNSTPINHSIPILFFIFQVRKCHHSPCPLQPFSSLLHASSTTRCRWW